MDFVLQTDGLTKSYKKTKALDGLTMHVPKGSIYGFVGRNGAGKTTLFRLICGLQEPSSGSFTLYGIRSDSKDITKARRRMGAVVEKPAVYMDMTAEENLKQQYLILGLPTYNGIPELLKLVGLDKAGNKKVKYYSMGMKQRLGIAIRQITILISSHILDELSRLATHYGIIDHGHMVKELSAKELDAACRKCTRLEVGDTSVLARVLDDLDVEYKIISGTTADIFAKINVTEITLALLKENCQVLSMQERDESLESYFISLLGVARAPRSQAHRTPWTEMGGEKE